MARTELTQAQDGAALQTYPGIEVVMVNAGGPDHPEPGAELNPTRHIPFAYYRRKSARDAQ